MTLIELIVVLGVITLIAALLVPAIQASREASRQATCRDRLRQVGVALHGFEGRNGHFPTGIGMTHSYVVPLLPDLEQAPLYQSLNLSVELARWGDPIAANQTAGTIRIGGLICPTDDATRLPKGMMSYPGSLGPGFGTGDLDEPSNHGFFCLGKRIGPRDFPDGTSSTVAVAEWVFGQGASDHRWGVYTIPTYQPRLGDFLSECEGLAPDRAAISSLPKGLSWMEGAPGSTLYQHDLQPNRRSCRNGHAAYHSAYTAGSRHGRGAHALFADGHVSWIAGSIGREVWWALGSRDGAETIPTSEW